MLLGGVSLPDAAVEQQLAASQAAFLGGTDPLYAQLNTQTVQYAERQPKVEKQALAGLMPIVYLGIRAAIETAEQPEIEALLPASVELRSAVLRSCSRLVISRTLRSGDLAAHYRDTEALAPLMAGKRELMITDFLRPRRTYETELTALGDVAILDEAVVAGGALRFLKREQPAALEAETAAAIVGRSVGLQLVARVPDSKLDVMRIRLGSPYTERKYLTFGNGVVDFTPEARGFLHNLQEPGAGCPAHSTLTQGIGSQPTFLRLVWADLAKVLLPPHAKADLPPQKRPIRPARPKRKR